MKFKDINIKFDGKIFTLEDIHAIVKTFQTKVGEYSINIFYSENESGYKAAIIYQKKIIEDVFFSGDNTLKMMLDECVEIISEHEDNKDNANSEETDHI